MKEALLEFVVQYGYFAIYGTLALGLIGLPLPDETLLVFVGSLTSYGHLTFYITVLAAFAGKLTGMIIGYFIGKKFGKPFLTRYGKWLYLNPARMEKSERWFRRYGEWAVGFGYFIPGVRHITCYLAAINNMSLWRYIMVASLGALVWCTTFVTLGHFIGDNWESTISIIDKYTGKSIAAAILVSSAILMAVIIYKRWWVIGKK